MKTLAVLAAALAISLTFAQTASAQVFGGGSSVSITRTSTDAFGNRRSVTRRITDNGFARCDASGGDPERLLSADWNCPLWWNVG